MSRYTVKKGEKDEIFLVDAQGNRLSVLQLIQDCGTSRVVALDAPMGTGKTTLIKQLVEEMGSTDIANSPTFAIVNVYEKPLSRPTDTLSPSRGKGHADTGKEDIYHFDCYRLKDIREAMDFGAEDYLYSGNWCFVEWPDIISPLLPEDTVWWHIRVKEDGDREIEVEG